MSSKELPLRVTKNRLHKDSRTLQQVGYSDSKKGVFGDPLSPKTICLELFGGCCGKATIMTHRNNDHPKTPKQRGLGGDWMSTSFFQKQNRHDLMTFTFCFFLFFGEPEGLSGSSSPDGRNALHIVS